MGFIVTNITNLKIQGGIETSTLYAKMNEIYINEVSDQMSISLSYYVSDEHYGNDESSVNFLVNSQIRPSSFVAQYSNINKEDTIFDLAKPEVIAFLMDQFEVTVEDIVDEDNPPV